MVDEENCSVQHISAVRDQPHPVRRPIRSFSLGITQPEENSLRRDIHPDCDLLGRHAAVGKAAADRLYVFSDLDDVSVGIIEAHDALTPGMLFDRVDIADILSAQPLGESVKVVLLEVQLAHLAVPCERIRLDELRPGLLRLQGDAAGQGDIRAEIRDFVETEYGFVK